MCAIVKFITTQNSRQACRRYFIIRLLSTILYRKLKRHLKFCRLEPHILRIGKLDKNTAHRIWMVNLKFYYPNDTKIPRGGSAYVAATIKI